MTLAERITRSLRGQWHGNYGIAFCPAHQNTRTPALSLANGDSGRLLVYCHAGCSFSTIMDALRERALVANLGSRNLPAADGVPSVRSVHEQAARKRESQAKQIWQKAVPIGGTLAERYLRGRGITARLPATLRYDPKCWHGPSAMWWPAMVALVEGGAHTAVHRTYLLPDGGGKATVAPEKMMLGATGGSAVRLADRAGPLVVAEGIETALSLGNGLLGRPATIWAALSASGVAGLRLPSSSPHQLIIAGDGDKAGRGAMYRLAERATKLGWIVSLLPAPEGRDWNDILMLKGGC